MGPAKKVKKLLEEGLTLVSVWAGDFRIYGMCSPISFTLNVMISWLNINMEHNLHLTFRTITIPRKI